jgi:hypothetical protein
MSKRSRRSETRGSLVHFRNFLAEESSLQEHCSALAIAPLPETTQYFVGLTGQQQWRLSDYYVLTYDFTYEKVHASDLV